MEKLWIDAVEFDDFGGFTVETQFVREMGQGYLLADGIGETLKPASVNFHVEENGMYRFFIRTKNWIVEHSPDGLIIEVDGIKEASASLITLVRCISEIGISKSVQISILPKANTP